MHQFSLLPFLIPFILSLTFSLSQAQYHQYSNCAPIPYTCGDVQFTLGYPFRSGVRPNYCGHPSFFLDCINKNSTLAISISNKLYSVRQVDTINKLLTIANPNFTGQSCPETYKNTTIDATLFEYVDDRDRNLTIYYNCTASSGIPLAYYVGCVLDIVRNSYYSLDNGSASSDICQSTVVIPMSSSAAGRLESGNASLGAALTEGFVVRWLVEGGWCPACVSSGGLCGYNQSVVDGNTCFCADGPAVDSCPYLGSDDKGGGTGKIIAAVVAAVGGFIFACALCLYCYRRKKRRQVLSSTLVFGVSSTKNSFGKDPEFGRADYQTHIFSYSELQDATDHFDSSQELGDGGFGTVYKGKLKDGRTVAVKRLYDNNYKRVEQFINEVAILSNLRHQNLVTLYGCTSHQTRELLLVYEFVSNGTLADHLHGPRAPERVLTWPLRMRVAIETAEALAYLHAVEPPIIHRDVKTNNILLDESFHVKVADFGLSRLVPADATHVSTAPQGTPGYLDPEYHQCYQLTDKSDVYSFGVVLVELISSKTAVDVNRGRNEINLATMALSRIQRKELDGLVDPELGYHSDLETKRMILVVAELAFRCLQMDRDMRPPIKEVLNMLRDLQSGESKVAGVGEADDRRDVVGLLRKSSLSFSPDSTEKWSRSTTSNSSG